ncbi:MAG TPA: hypothetical protein ENF73_01445 [Proteobacteria bacterium]|nr:hypothetical protein [Pseudomonadota bacterium]
MKVWQKVVGIEGFVLLVFGLLSYLFAPEAKIFATIFLALGLVLLAAFLIMGAPQIAAAFSKRTMRVGTMVATYSLIALLIVVAINFIAARHSKSIDLTSAKVNTLSDQSQKVLAQLKEPVEIVAFFKKVDVRGLKDLLKLYEQSSDKFSFRIVDPDVEPQEAKRYGVSQYGTLVAVCGERKHLFNGTDEESITNAIIKVTRLQKGVIYFVDGHGEHDIDSNEESGYAFIKKGLENENFKIKKLILAQVEKIPDDAQALVIAGPKKPYIPQEVELIEKYMESGGRVLIMLDPATESGLEELCDSYGVAVQNTIIVDQQIKLFEGPTLGVAPIVTEYGYHPAVKDFKEATIFPLCRSLKPIPARNPDLDIAVIAKTSAASWGETDLDRLWNKGEVELNENEDFSGPLPVAIAVSWKPQDQEQETEGEQKADAETEPKRKMRLVVVGDSDFASNQYVTYYYNGDFFLNLINWIIGEETYISIRPHKYAPSFIQLTTNQKALIFFLSVFLIPQIIVMVGIVVILWRNRK